MTRLFLGWDVGAWNCDHNPRSRDALCVVAPGSDHLQLMGAPWRGNLRGPLTQLRGRELLSDLLARCGVHIGDDDTAELTIAIDTPLGWPKAMRDLLNSGTLADVSDDASGNPYLFRLTERWLAERGKQPLSAVRDMIGSQSTKGIHFLAAAGLAPARPGWWEGRVGESLTVRAFETYPAPCRSSSRVCSIFNSVRSSVFLACGASAPNGAEDLADALRCAIVAALAGDESCPFAGPPDTLPDHEGWIWLPDDWCASTARGGTS